MSELYTVKEVADKLKVSTRTVTTYCKEGLIEAHKLKREYRITEEALRKFLKANELKEKEQ